MSADKKPKGKTGTGGTSLPARPDYGDARLPTAHSIMFGGSNKPRGTPNMAKPPNTPQGPHSDARVGVETALREAQAQGNLGKVRKVVDPDIGPAMGAALKKRRTEVPERMDVFDQHRLARSNSLDRHEKRYDAFAKGKDPRPPNTEAHFQSTASAYNLNPYSTTHHLGRKPATKKFTAGKGESLEKTMEEMYDRRSVTASSTGRPGLKKEYDDVHQRRAKVLQPYVEQAKKSALDDG